MSSAPWFLSRRTPGILAVLSLGLATSAAAPVRRPPAGGRVAGTVRDGEGAPIAGARIVVVGRPLSVASDAAGAYLLPSVPVGPVTVRASSPGHRSDAAGGTVMGGAMLTLDFTLVRLGARPDPKARAEVQLPTEEARERDRQPTEAITKSDRAAGVSSSPPPLGAAGLAQVVSEPWRWQQEPGNTEAYSAINENRFHTAAGTPVSTFSIDVDAASYSNVRRFFNQGTLPPADAVRLEELVNYFPYRYPDRTGRHPFAVSTEVGPCPWSPEHRLVRIGLQAHRVPTRALPPSNLVFLIDVSGSMMAADKLPLVQQAFRALVRELRPEDRVAIVVYAGAAGLVLPSTGGDEQQEILAAIDRLQAGGSTAGGAGIRLAYDVAREHFDPAGNNRVILATDGDFNVGVSSDAEMVRLVEQRREEGTFLTVLGFGTGNLRDSKMDQMADRGNGHYAYIDSDREARKVFVQEFGGTLFTVAKDVKIQVEFNPAQVQSYRLLGYENRLLEREDFEDDRKDAGELGSGHSVTALYEIVPPGANPVAVASENLKYQRVSVRPATRHSGEVLTVRVRYKDPQGSVSRLLETPVGGRVGSSAGGEVSPPASDDMRFATAVAAFALLLRDSDHRGQASFEQVLALAHGARGQDEDGYRGEFIGLVETARALSGAMPVDRD